MKEKSQSEGNLTQFERAGLVHRLHEEVEQTLIGISLITRAHAQKLKLLHSGEARVAVRIQRLLERNIVQLDELIKALDGGKLR